MRDKGKTRTKQEIECFEKGERKELRKDKGNSEGKDEEKVDRRQQGRRGKTKEERR